MDPEYGSAPYFALIPNYKRWWYSVVCRSAVRAVRVAYGLYICYRMVFLWCKRIQYGFLLS
jgi:hypothetical protein